jgi:peptidyl-prolyl cis-trans isomerase A (cyclophilin A)
MRAVPLFIGAVVLCGCSRQPQPAAPSAGERSPDSYKVRFDTTRGEFVMTVNRAWAPLGADRFYTLVKSGFYDGARFFRVIPGFVVQFGIPGDTALNARWRNADLTDDPVTQSNQRATVSFATSGPNTRATQVFINLVNSARLDGHGFAPFGVVSQGMETVDAFYSAYGESPPMGGGPAQTRIEKEGNAYLEREFPKLDYIKKASIEK